MQTIEPEADTGNIDRASLTDDERRELAERIFLDRRGQIGGAERAREVGWATRTGTKWARGFFFASLVYLPALVLVLCLDVAT